METSLTYEIAGGSVALWLDEAGAIQLKVRESSGDPVHLAEHEALGLAAFLMRLTLEPVGGT
ncbi:MAG TPA: hypothetical protein VJ299_01965 [Steroidobacteraceae bacterium]|jgi:hypothetical protein|nr:hypothetical protein [Steroidobacteraceae bacterium]HJY42428.1 hypothetical protein [Steroidobacteraceae bacterium]